MLGVLLVERGFHRFRAGGVIQVISKKYYMYTQGGNTVINMHYHINNKLLINRPRFRKYIFLVVKAC